MAPKPPSGSERPGVAGGAPRSARRALLICVALTFVLHVGMYVLNTQMPIHLLRLGGSHAQIGWLFGVTTVVGLVLRPQVGGWTDRYGARAVMLPGALALIVTMLALPAAASPLAVIALMTGLGVGAALISTTGSIVVANESPGDRRGESLSLFYVFSSAGVALGPPIGFVLADLGGMRLNFAVLIGLSLVTIGLVLALGNAMLAAPPTVLSLVAGAALLGCGNSMLYPTLVALVVDRTPAVERGRAIGTLSGAWDVGVAIGAPTIALLVQTQGYAAGFLASAIATALGLATFLATERHRRLERHHGSTGAG